MPASIEIVREPEKAAVLLDPEKRRLLERLRAPDSAAGLARQLGLGRQQVNYHLRELEAAGLVALVGERRKGNCVERLVRATAASYVISPEAMGRLGCGCGCAGCGCPAPGEDAAPGARLASAAGRALRDMGGSARGALPPLEAEIRFRSAAERDEFERELAVAFGKLVRKYDNPRGRSSRFRVLAACWPSSSGERCAGCAGTSKEKS